MTCSVHTNSTSCPCRRSNCLAVLIAGAAVTFLYIDFQPRPAGAECDLMVATVATPSIILPRATSETPAAEPGEPVGSESETAAVAPQTDLERNIALLERGIARLESQSDYAAQFHKVERVDGAMQDEQVIFMKVRHQPFSVYFKWLTGDVGREVLYVDGLNDGKMLVHAGGWKARLLPVLKIDPLGSIALREARHPITRAGLLNLTKTLLENRRTDQVRNKGSVCRAVEGQQFNSRPCWCYVVEYDAPEFNETYRKSVSLIDQELLVPVCIQNYTWPSGKYENAAQLDAETLVESYSYTDIVFNQQLADVDFDTKNSAYTFRR